MCSSVLPQYSGPLVTIPIGDDSDDEYKLPKNLLCSQSPYFERVLIQSKKGEHLPFVLEPINEIDTKECFQMLIQWIHQGRVIFPPLKGTDQITLAVGFVKLCAVCEITGVEAIIAEHIKALLLKSPGGGQNANTVYLSPHHLRVARTLPKLHAVRKLLIVAMVEGYLGSEKFAFYEAMSEIPDLAADPLAEVKTTLKTLQVKRGHYDIEYRDPLKRTWVWLNK